MKVNFIAYLSLFFLIGSYVPVCAQPGTEHKAEEINWMSFEEAVQLNEKEPKKIFIDVYTNWCGWCKRMDATTFKDSAIVAYMNKNYYAVKLNAETHDTIRFKGKAFVFRPEYRVNELALSLHNGKMSGYPSYIFLDEKYNLLTILPGYQQVADFIKVLRYFGENLFKTITWENYHNQKDP